MTKSKQMFEQTDCLKLYLNTNCIREYNQSVDGLITIQNNKYVYKWTHRY